MSAHEVIQLIEEAGFVPAEQITCNPRARTGRDLLECADHTTYTGFNPRARTGRDLLECADHTTYTGFNPRARTGRDIPSGWDLFVSSDVSIHAPARGAT